MSNIGLGVMIKYLSGDQRTSQAIASSIGKRIEQLSLEDDLLFTFTDGTKLKISDDRQSCCERRYMRTDDILPEFIGADFLGTDLKDSTYTDEEYGDVHEIQFLEIKTSKGVFIIASHNEHNGYYGGFNICASIID